MARPRRRRPTLPDHDPRAIRSALRREIYELGDSLRFLDDIEFVVVEREGVGPAIRPLVNGTDVVDVAKHVPLPVWAHAWHYGGLNDADGHRGRVPFTGGPPPGYPCCTAKLAISVAGRYVRWTFGNEVENGEFVFDRATYRERLAAVLDAHREHEPAKLRLLREFYEQTPWEGPLEMGLGEPWVCGTPYGQCVRFFDRFWRATVYVIIGEFREPLEQCLPRAKRVIAQWQPENLGAEWFGPARPPHYPSHWKRQVFP